MNKSLICVLLTAMMFVAGCGDESSGSKNDGGDSLCGNQTIDDGEQCDDGNAFDGDGCSQNCVVESGWKCPSEGGACSQETPVEPASECGNSKVETGESCDDGNRVSGDGCSGNCKIEEGWSCPQEGQACEHIPSCGDGLVEGDEQCDDHNAVSGDGCSSECRIEEGFQCPIEGQACTPMTCGDGHVDKNMGEVCDSGSDNVEYGGFLKLCGTNCQWAHYCGDGLLDEVDIKNGEECDRMGVEDDYNGCSSDCKRVNFCGDGKVTHEEACDDGNLANGDGCSEHCTIEDNFKCDIVNGQSHCTEFPCGNGKLDENETCDDGNRISGDGCSASCYLERGYLCEGTVCTSVIGNGKLEPESGEQCDDGNTISGDGCSSTGVLEAGWYCPTPGSPCIARACGDGIVAGNEECDDGNTDDYDGCSYRCEIETGWNCVDGKNCVEGYCGDGIVQVGEECDNDIVALYSTPASGDGCSSSCTIESGYACMSQGGECKTVVCGDGTIDPGDSFTSYETCDLGENLNDGSAGCAADCTIVKGWACDADGKNCASGQCGDGILQVGEECDDGNTMPGDGCSPKCTIETGLRCENGSCKPICGDGVTMWMLLDHAEECDDGNLVNGDGCSSDCKIETGFTCTEFSQAAVPDFIAVPVVYRDFRSTNRDVYSETNADGFITDELIKKYPGAKWSNRLHKTMTDFDAQSGCPKTGYTLSTLDEDHKPVLSQDAFGTCFSSKTEFGLWYRNVPGLNKEVKHKLHMWLTDNASKSYYFTSDKPTTNNAPNTLTDGTAWSFPGFFLPIGPSDGFGPTGGWNDRNYSFTSEVTTYFQYKGNETLKFSGDDDLWVFLNGHLFVDLGGLHAILDGSNTLKAETCDVVDKDGNTKQIACDPNFEVYEGGVYELKLFHAERNATGSNFSLTLTGFLNSGTASCSAICGDGLVMGDEQCDPIAVEEAVAELMTKENIDEKAARSRVNEQVAFLGCVNCQNVAYCGNGKIEEGEQCDLGIESTEWCDKENIDECDDSQWCSRSQCKLTDSVCGNGIKEGHEECDGNDGVNQDQTCLETCRISGCGDGIVDQSRGEECDDGNDSNEDACTTSCRHPFCGDGIVSTYLGEVCDDGPDGNDGAYGHCGLGCTYWAPRCGDGHVDVENGEVCDDGVNNGEYNGCMPGCQSLPARCGDGITQEENGETCDDGEDNGKGSCSTACIQVIN